MDPEVIFTQCLRSALSGASFSNDMQPLSYEQFEKVYQLACRHDVVQIVYIALKKQHLLPKIEDDTQHDLLNRANQKLLSTVVYSEKMSHTIRDIDKALNDAHVQHVFLKGAVLRQHYPETWMRTSGDIDCLVPTEELNHAIKALVAIGFHTHGEKQYHDIALNRGQIHLELHFSICENKPPLDAVLSTVWNCVEPQSAYTYKELPEFFVFHHMAHMAYHLVSGGFGVKPIMDLWIINQRITYNQMKVRNLCEQAGILVLYETAMQLIKVWFDNAEHSTQTTVLQEYILRSGAFGTAENTQQARHLMEATRKEKLWQYIFLPGKEIRRLYPVANKHAWLIPFFEVRRWFEKMAAKGSRDLLKRVLFYRGHETNQLESIFQKIGISHLLG